ncbi:MAG: restriction endonuclease subunit S, partial [Deltaproteobacteria bacterium]
PYSAVQKGYTTFKEGDVLFAKITPCMENGKIAIVPSVQNGHGFGSTEFHVLRPGTAINAKYLYYFISGMQFRMDAEHNMSGAVGQRRVTTPYLAACEIPLPPLPEQHRIVAKIEELFSELDKGVESLKTARDQLKVYRQALLKHAFEGKLTEKWREENKGIDVVGAKQGSAASPVFDLRGNRHVDQNQNKSQNQGEADETLASPLQERERVPSKRRKDLPPLSAEELAELPELPLGWEWVKLGNTDAEISDGPFGSNLKTSDYVAKGVRVVRLENIGVLEFIENRETYITEEKYDLLKRHTVTAGDIIFSSFILENIRVALIPPSITKAINKADCFCVRLAGETLFSSYAVMFLSSRHVYKQLEALIHGIGRPRINTTQLKSVAIPVCCIEEQKTITSELDSRLSATDQLDQTIATALQQSETLRQSILKKAFSGQLVPQDPHDEPAAVLLERIKAERITTKSVGAKQVSSASPAFDLRGNRRDGQNKNKSQNQGEAGEALASPLRKGSLHKSQKRISA